MAACNYVLMFLGFFLFGAVAPVHAQVDEAPAEVAAGDVSADVEAGKKGKKKKSGKKAKKTEAGEAEAELSPVGAALKELKTLTGKANLRADYYIYLSSSSWCRYCQECMPIAVKEYAKMRRSKKVELVIINGDGSAEKAAEYIKSYKAKCPYILFDEVKNARFQNLPGCSFAIGAPAAAIVSNDGQLVKNGIGAKQVKELLADWKKLTTPSKEKARK